MKQTALTTVRKGRVDERKKDWTRKPETPKKRERANVRSFLSSVHLSGIKTHLPTLFTTLAEISQFKKNEMGWACGAYGRGEGGV